MHLVNILRIITFSFLVGHSILTINDFNGFRVFLGRIRPNYAFSIKFYLIDREKQDKLLLFLIQFLTKNQPNFNQFFLSRWAMHSKNFV